MRIGFVKDWRLIASIAAAHVLLFVTFSDQDIFWYIYTAANLFFMSISIISEKIDDQQKTNSFMAYGLLSGAVLYVLFAIGFWMISMMSLSVLVHVSAIYAQFTPQFVWHYIVLVLIFIPGEELFWRGFVQKRLNHYMNEWASALIASALFGSVFLYSGQWIWTMAAFCAGLFWGGLYIWKKSIPMLIISHLIFDLLLIVFLPLG